jgi:hypothetical protein
MSDWIGVYSTSQSIKAGLNLEMPYVPSGISHCVQLIVSILLQWPNSHARESRRKSTDMREAFP